MNELEFKKTNKMAACTAPPWAAFIPPMERPEVLRIIRQETVDAYGYSMDECPKRLTCLKKTCLGRPLPWLSPTAKPYLEQLKETQKIVKDEMIVQTDCSVCPFVSTCKNPCNQVLDFIERAKAPEPILDYKETTDNLEAHRDVFEGSTFKVNAEDIPWDVISPKKAEVIRKYLFESRDFRYIADLLNLNNQARVKYEFYSAINKLAEYAAVRKFLDGNSKKLTDRQQQIFTLVYRDNLSYVEVADMLGVSKQSIQQTVSRVFKKYKVKWKVYVRKKDKKVHYNVPELFKT